MKRGPEYYVEAYESFLQLRGLPLLAAKELFYVDSQIEIEKILLSKRKRDPEQHLNDHTELKPVSHVGPQILRRRDRRHLDSTDEPGKGSASQSVPYVNTRQGPMGEAASEDGDSQRKDIVRDSHSRRFSYRSTNYLKLLWQRMVPQSGSVNYWQKVGQLFTKRRIRRVFSTRTLPLSLF